MFPRETQRNTHRNTQDLKKQFNIFGNAFLKLSCFWSLESYEEKWTGWG